LERTTVKLNNASPDISFEKLHKASSAYSRHPCGNADMSNEEHVQTLMGFGLTFLQAKTYLALAKLGKADVKTTAKVSNIARQDIYRIMPTLQKIGLAEKIIAKPTIYRATPIKDGLSVLLQNRQKETSDLKKKTASLMKTFHAQNVKTAHQTEEPQFILTSELTRFIRMHEKLYLKTQKSTDAIFPFFPTITTKNFDVIPQFKKMTTRGVKIRLITQMEKEASKKLQGLEKNPLFEIKYLKAPPHFGMHIFDKKEVTLEVSMQDFLPSLWSNNPTVVELAVNYFNELWSKKQ
jgi:sugar-specific transcriptional regulator TrmB